MAGKLLGLAPDPLRQPLVEMRGRQVGAGGPAVPAPDAGAAAVQERTG
jgi:hypothetical protein